jgi:glycine dehydrogenase subunit 1
LSLHHKPEARRVVISETIHPDWRQVLATYARSLGVSVEQIPMAQGVTDQDALGKALQRPAACVIVQNPNFFGHLENLEPMGKSVHDVGGLFVVSAYPIALGLLKPPSEEGADIVVGEGQCLGGPIGYGGPYLGIFACKDFLKRRLPGRIVGQTEDRNGKRGYVLTMQAREQHIRREKATSNICTNQSLLALTACMYLGALGKEGFYQVALTNAARARQLQDGLMRIKGVRAAFEQPFFNEFTVVLDRPVKGVQDALLRECFIAGLDLSPFSPALRDHLLLCATETKTEEDIAMFVQAFAKAMQS